VTARPLLTVEDLRVVFEGDRGTVTEAVAGVSFSLAPGRTLGIVGESGCGKSVTALAIMRLLPKAHTRVSGSVAFEGRELGSLPERQMQDLRGNRLAMIFQEPMTSLNPSFTIGDQIGEALQRGALPSTCWSACACPPRTCASTSIPTSSRAACASA